jgi:hypothetical protein
MKILPQLEVHFRKIEEIRYENPNGGAYAYLQFLAYTRELMVLLHPLERVSKQLDALEGINWLFNECLAASFTHRQKAIFDNKISEAKHLFEVMRIQLQDKKIEELETRNLHKQAA